MIPKLDNYLAQRSTWTISCLVAIAIAIVAIADFYTGPLLSFSIFYVLPVALASWYAPRTITVLVCLAATVAWLYVELNSIDYQNELIPVWNAGVRLGFFVTTSVLLIALKTSLLRQQELANTDGLTGILNRRAFEDRCEYLFSLAERQNRVVSLGYLDIDEFKSANDAFGHQRGDEILIGIAEILEKNLRSSDILGRIGGDEFAVALADMDRDQVQSSMQRVIAQLRDAATINQWSVGFSFGIVVCRSPMPDLLAALNYADKLMYTVKQQPSDGLLVREFDTDIEFADSGV